MSTSEVSLPEAARILGLSWAQTYQRLLTRRLVGRRVHGRWAITRQSIEDYAERQRRAGLRRPPLGSGEDER